MRTRALVVALFALGLSASVALAAPTKGKPPKNGTTTITTSTSTTTTTTTKGRKPPKSGTNCVKPAVSVILGGALTTAPGAAGTSLALTVKTANAFGRAYRNGSQPVTVLLDSKTVFRRNGAKTRAALVAGDRVQVQSKACKGTLVNGATPPLTARRVDAHPAKAPGGTTTTTTTTTS